MAATSLETKKLFNSIDNRNPDTSKPPARGPTLRFSDYSSVELSEGTPASGLLRINVAPGCSINYDDTNAGDVPRISLKRDARLIESAKYGYEIEFN